MRFRHLSRIKVRAMLLGIVPAAVVSLILGSYLFNAQYNSLDEAFTERGRAMAKEAAAISVFGLFIRDREILQSSLEPVLARADVIGLSVRDEKGDILFRFDAPGQDEQGERPFFADVLSRMPDEALSDYPEASEVPGGPSFTRLGYVP
ncbi:MAG: hypothetical protein AB2807_10655 [Candidatus Sedimenticola endophacoides]